MYVVTYADAENHINRKNDFLTVQEAEKLITENNIIPFKILFDRGDDCPETVKDYKNYMPGKYTVEYLFKKVIV